MFQEFLKHPEKFSFDQRGFFSKNSPLNALLVKCSGKERHIEKAAVFLSDRLNAIEMERITDLPADIETLCLEIISHLEGKKAGEILQEKLFGYRYRKEKEVQFEDAALVFNAFAKAEEWKKNEPFFWEKELSSEEKALIAPLVRKYGRIFRWILSSEERSSLLWIWLIRDQLPGSIFFEFPYFRDRLIRARMTGRVGRTGILRLKKEGSTKKVTLLIEGQEVEVTDPDKEIVLGEGWILTLNEIFQIFEEKKFLPGNLECFSTGIHNWNSHLLGRWNPRERKWIVSPLHEKWWEQLPCFEALTEEQVKERYRIQDGNWGIVARAARERPNLDYENTHAYLELVIPVEGVYRIYHLGKFARKFPKNLLELMQTFSATVPGTVAYPDENVYNTDRQHMGFVFEITEDKGLLCMEFIKKEIEKARNNRMAYQIATENCGKWTQDVLDHVIDKEKMPNLFYTSLIDAEPRGIMKGIFSWIRRLRPEFRALALNVIHYPWGSWKGSWIHEKEGEEVFKTITRSSFWQDTLVHLPAHLHEKQSEEISQNRASLTYQRKQERLVKRV